MDFQQDEEEEEEGEMSPDHMKDSEVRCCSCRFFLIYAVYGFYKFTSYGFQEPSNKRVKPVGKSNSLTGVIPQMKTPALKRFSQSISVRMLKYAHAFTAYISVQIVSVILSFFHSGLLAFAQRLDLCPRLSPVLARSPPRFHAGAAASAGATQWRATTSRPRKSNAKRCEGQKGRSPNNFWNCRWTCASNLKAVCLAPSLHFSEAASHGVLWKRMWAGTKGSTSFTNLSAVINSCWLNAALTSYATPLSEPDLFWLVGVAVCSHGTLSFSAGDLWADSGRKTADRGPQFG